MDDSLGHYTLTQMSDTSTPTVEEAALLSAYGDETSLCQDRTLAEVSALDPRAGKTLQVVNASQRDVALALIGREITWGEYSRRTQSLIDRASGRAQPTPRQIASNDTSATDAPPSRGIGITGDKITDSSSASVAMSDPHGVFVRSVQAQSAAALAGIRPGDIILSFDDKRVENPEDLDRDATASAGHSASLQIWRNRVVSKVAVNL